MNVSNLYRKLKQILNEANTALLNKGFNRVNSFSEIIPEIESHGEINRLPYLLRDEVFEITEEDLRGITKISSYAFYINFRFTHLNTAKLHTVRIPSSVTLIEEYAFYGDELSIFLRSPVPPTLEGYLGARVYVPKGSEDAYRSATNWSNCDIRTYNAD